MLHLVTEKPEASDLSPGLKAMAQSLGRFEAVWPQIRGWAYEAVHGDTELQRTMAASLLAHAVLQAEEMGVGK